MKPGNVKRCRAFRFVLAVHFYLQPACAMTRARRVGAAVAWRRGQMCREQAAADDTRNPVNRENN
jgi:hypothetical protein